MRVQPGSSPHLFAVESETDAATWYQVFANGTVVKCTCKGYLTHKTCKHLAVVQDYVQQTAGGSAAEAPPETPQPDTDRLSPWVTHIHGKAFIRYEGLLALAHAQGLLELGAVFVSVTGELALAWAWARFTDGRTFWEAGDATPGNVHPQVRSHFARVALTRAKARTLRDALNIGMVAVEELGE